MNTGNSSTKHVADTIYFCIREIKYYLTITRLTSEQSSLSLEAKLLWRVLRTFALLQVEYE